MHDSFGLTSEGYPIFPSDVTRAAVYIARNPLVIVISYSFHYGIPFQTIINQLNNPACEISRSINDLKPQVGIHLGSWSTHIISWTKQMIIPIIFITFEQLLENASQVFRELLNQLEISYSEKTFAEALSASGFSNLKKEEEAYGFKEKPLQASTFFREEKQANYIHHRKNERLKEIIDNHYEMMKKLGYLNAMI